MCEAGKRVPGPGSAGRAPLSRGLCTGYRLNHPAWWPWAVRTEDRAVCLTARGGREGEECKTLRSLEDRGLAVIQRSA